MPVLSVHVNEPQSAVHVTWKTWHANIQELARIAREFPLKFPSTYRYGRGAGVGRGRGVGVVLGAGVAVGVGVAVAVAVAVAVGVGEGDAQGLTGQVKLNIEATMALLPS